MCRTAGQPAGSAITRFKGLGSKGSEFGICFSGTYKRMCAHEHARTFSVRQEQKEAGEKGSHSLLEGLSPEMGIHSPY